MSRKSTSLTSNSTQIQTDWIIEKLKKGEQSGFTTDTKDDILKQSKTSLND